MTTKKATPAKAVTSAKPKKILPKIGEIGFKFKVDAEITRIYDNWDEEEDGRPIKGYQVNLYLGEEFAEYTFTMEQLKEEISLYDPKQQKSRKQEEIKKAEEVVARLKKELEEM